MGDLIMYSCGVQSLVVVLDICSSKRPLLQPNCTQIFIFDEEEHFLVLLMF